MNPNEPKQVRAGIIGTGFGQTVHVPAFRLAGCKVVALAARSEDRARAVAGKLGIARCYGNWQSMLDDEKLDAVSIAVPPILQSQIVQVAAERGIAVFCEKPAAADVPSARTMCRMATEAKIVHAINFLFPEIPMWQKARELIQQGAIGRLRHAALSWRVETYAVRTNAQGWKRSQEMGGGTLNNFVSHCAYYLEWMFGPLAALTAKLFPRDGSGDDRVDAWLEFQSGMNVGLAVATDCPLGSGHRLEIHGDEGALTLHNPGADYINGFHLTWGIRGDQPMKTISQPAESEQRDGRIAATSSIVRRFAECITKGGGELKPDLRDGLRVQEILDTFRLSHQSGLRREVPGA